MKQALVFFTLRLARGCNVLDNETAAGSWKGREGRQVRKYTGDYKEIPDQKRLEALRLYRGCQGPVIFPDTMGLHLPRSAAESSFYRYIYIYRFSIHHRVLVLHFWTSSLNRF